MRDDETGKVVLVTGASSGIGALSVRALALAGHTVYAGIRQIATRSASAAADLTRSGTDHRVGVHAVELDVVVHNAGHMVLGAAEVLPFGIGTAIVVPGASLPAPTTSPTQAPPPTSTAEAYDQRHRSLMGDLGKRLAALIPSDADVTAVAEAVARPAAMKHGTRPLRTHIDPDRGGSEVVCAVADRLRADFFRRIGLDSLLTAGSSL